MKGIDVSSNQGTIDFAKVKASGIEIVYIKATEGIAYTDSTLKAFYNNAKAARLKVGFYHFLRANDPSTEAKHFLSATAGLIPDCKYVIDVELALGQTVATLSNNVRKFADYLISQGKKVALYTGDYFYRDNLNSTVKDLPLWVANYGTTTIARTHVGWQYSETGSVNGISSKVDLDTFDNGILIEEVVRVNDIVIYADSVDQVFADQLADFLKCPTINGNRPYDYSNIKNVYWVGGPSKLGMTSYVTVKLIGANRQETETLVNNFIASKSK
jgi:GH25 family lysozyme M1 (1,4-beta-N-acetylmuramidase)